MRSGAIIDAIILLASVSLPFLVTLNSGWHGGIISMIILGFSMLVFGVRIAMGKQSLVPSEHRTLLISAAVFLSMVTVSYLVSDNFGAMWWGARAEFGTVAASILFLVGMLAALYASDRGRAAMLRWLVICASVACAYVLGATFFSALPPLGETWPELSSVFGVALLTAIIFAAEENGARRALFACCAVLIAGSMLALPHAAVLASLAAASMAAIAILVYRKLHVSALTASIGALCLFSIGVLTIGPDAPVVPVASSPALSSAATQLSVVPMLYSSPRHFLFGSGPNSFSSVWDEYHPAIFNSTPLWDAGFSTGSSAIFTLLASFGVLGASLFILVAFLSLRRAPAVQIAGHRLIFIAAAAGMLVFFFMHSFSTELFVALGVLLGSAAASSAHREEGVSLDAARGGLRTRAASLAILGIGCALLYVSAYQFLASQYYERARSMHEQSPGSAAELYGTARSLWNVPEYRREQARAYFDAARSLAGTSATNNALRDQFTRFIERSISSIDAAVSFNMQDYGSWLLRARIFLSFGAQDSDIEAALSLDQMEKLAPVRPETYYLRAVLARRMGDRQRALEEVGRALALKPDYQNARDLAAALGYTGSLR